MKKKMHTYTIKSKFLPPREIASSQASEQSAKKNQLFYFNFDAPEKVSEGKRRGQFPGEGWAS